MCQEISKIQERTRPIKALWLAEYTRRMATNLDHEPEMWGFRTKQCARLVANAPAHIPKAEIDPLLDARIK